MKEKLSNFSQELSQSFGDLLSEKEIERSLLLIQGILESKTVNLAQCAEDLSLRHEMTEEQIYRQYIRHFQTGNVSKYLKASFLCIFNLTHSFCTGELVMDRTEWKIGETWHNVLVIGYICGGNLVPLIWEDLGQKGNSDEAIRIQLFQRLRAWWRVTGKPMPQLTIYGDREFIGHEWFAYLVKNNINFVIRLKENQKFYIWKEGKISAKKYSIAVLSRYIKKYQLTNVELVIADEVLVPFVSVEKRTQNAENPTITDVNEWYLAANIPLIHEAAQGYGSRWTVENTFGHYKSKGLNLECFNLSGQHKLELMFSLLGIIYALAIHQVLSENLMQEVKRKKFENQKVYVSKSMFQVGLKTIRKNCLDVASLVHFCMDLFLKYVELTAYST
jgi:hypothetical protein